jgi:hypothetical protein
VDVMSSNGTSVKPPATKPPGPNRWQPGERGHPPGQRIGISRRQLSNRLLEDLTAVWEVEGAGCLRIVAKENPDKFASLAYAILPRDILVSVDQRIPGNLSVEDWALMNRVLDIIKAAQVDGSPGEVFSVIETSLRQHYAKAITNISGE